MLFILSMCVLHGVENILTLGISILTLLVKSDLCSGLLKHHTKSSLLCSAHQTAI